MTAPRRPGYLDRLAARASGAAAGISPRLRARFEPPGTGGSSLVELAEERLAGHAPAPQPGHGPAGAPPPSPATAVRSPLAAAGPEPLEGLVPTSSLPVVAAARSRATAEPPAGRAAPGRTGTTAAGEPAWRSPDPAGAAGSAVERSRERRPGTTAAHGSEDEPAGARRGWPPGSGPTATAASAASPAAPPPGVGAIAAAAARAEGAATARPAATGPAGVDRGPTPPAPARAPATGAPVTLGEVDATPRSAAAGPDHDQAAPVIEVTISRIEMWAAPAAADARWRQARRRERPPVPLDEYLRQRSRRR